MWKASHPTHERPEGSTHKSHHSGRIMLRQALSRNHAVGSRTGILPVPPCKAAGDGQGWFAEPNRLVFALENFRTGWKRCPTGAADRITRFSTASFRLSRNHAVGLGGTGDPPVLGGNLPPSRTHGSRSSISTRVVRTAVGRVARQNGPVARSTRNSTASSRLRDVPRFRGHPPISSVGRSSTATAGGSCRGSTCRALVSTGRRDSSPCSPSGS